MRVKNRRGTSVLEAVTALVLLGAMTMLAVQAAGMAAAQRRGSRQHAVALQEAANILERLGTMPWKEITAEKAAEIKLSEEADVQSCDATATVTVEAIDESPAAKRITVTIAWGVAEKSRKVSLSRWRTRIGEEP